MNKNSLYIVLGSLVLVAIPLFLATKVGKVSLRPSGTSYAQEAAMGFRAPALSKDEEAKLLDEVDRMAHAESR